jgi:hypothetical protein
MSNLYSQTEIVSDSDQLAIRDGRMYRAYFKFTVAPLTTKQILIKTASEVMTVFHGRFIDTVGANAQLVIFSGPTFSSQGTENLKKFNMNSLSLNVTTARFWENPVVSVKGSEVDSLLLAGGSQAHVTSGSRDVMEFERIFPPDLYFLSEFTNLDNTNSLTVVYKVVWEEVSFE